MLFLHVVIVGVTFSGLCYTAMLTVEDDEFWQGVSPVEFGTLPALQDAVTVVGYPIGGDTISVTSGVVSRIEILSYVHGSTELLGLQVEKSRPLARTTVYNSWFFFLLKIFIGGWLCR